MTWWLRNRTRCRGTCAVFCSNVLSSFYWELEKNNGIFRV